MRVVSMRMNVPPLECPFWPPEGTKRTMRCLGASNKIHAHLLDRYSTGPIENTISY